MHQGAQPAQAASAFGLFFVRRMGHVKVALTTTQQFGLELKMDSKCMCSYYLITFDTPLEMNERLLWLTVASSIFLLFPAPKCRWVRGDIMVYVTSWNNRIRLWLHNFVRMHLYIQSERKSITGNSATNQGCWVERILPQY